MCESVFELDPWFRRKTWNCDSEGDVSIHVNVTCVESQPIQDTV